MAHQINRAIRYDGRGHPVVGLDATDDDILLAINRDDPTDPSPNIGAEFGVFSTLTLDINTGQFIDSTGNDTLINKKRIGWSRISYNPIDRLTGKYGHFISFIDPIYYDTITHEFIFNEIDSFTTQVLWKSIDPADNYYDPPINEQHSTRWRRIKDSLWWDTSSSAIPIKSHDGRSMLMPFITSDTANYQCYMWEASYDDGRLTAHDRSSNWQLLDSTSMPSFRLHPEGYLIQTIKPYSTSSHDTQGYLLIDHDFNLIKKVTEITFDGYKMTHAESLPLPGDDGRLLHICRRQGDSDIYYYIEQKDGSYHLAGQLHNPNRLVYAFLPKDHTWDNSGNLVGHFQVMLDSATASGEKFHDGKWLFLYKINKDNLKLEPPTSTIDVHKPTEVRLSPNPGIDIVTMACDLKYNRVEVYSTGGELVKVQHNSSSNMNCSKLPPGLYIFWLYDNDRLIGQAKWIKVE